MAKKYLYYACFKNSRNGGMACNGRSSMEEANRDLQRLIATYMSNELIFIGIIKCADNNPLGHIYSLN